MSLSARIRAYVRQQHVGLIALFFVLAGGSAYALDGSNTVFTDDIVSGAVRQSDLGVEAVSSSRIVDGGVAGIDLAPNAVTSAKVRDHTIGADDLDASAVEGLASGRTIYDAEVGTTPATTIQGRFSVNLACDPGPGTGVLQFTNFAPGLMDVVTDDSFANNAVYKELGHGEFQSVAAPTGQERASHVVFSYSSDLFGDPLYGTVEVDVVDRSDDCYYKLEALLNR
jgi:hypothetical protein